MITFVLHYSPNYAKIKKVHGVNPVKYLKRILNGRTPSTSPKFAFSVSSQLLRYSKYGLAIVTSSWGYLWWQHKIVILKSVINIVDPHFPKYD